MNLLKEIIIFILKLESLLVLRKYKPKIITITGNVGKTTTKSAIYKVLSKFFFVRKCEKSYNKISLPLAILGCPFALSNPFIWIGNILKGISLILFKHPYPEWLILEAGIRKPSDAKSTSWIYSDIVVITPFGPTPTHIEFFESREHLIEEKSSLISTLKKGGLLALNADEEATLKLKNKTKARVFTFGFSDEATISVSNEQILYEEDKVSAPEGIMFRVNYNGNSVPIVVKGAFGRDHMYAAAAALGIAYENKLNMVTAAGALENFDTPPGRMRLIKGIKNTCIIDDTYNSSPVACEAALRTLKKIEAPSLPALPAQAGQAGQSGRKIAVLADMLELGKHTDEAHKQVGRLAAESADILVTVGLRARSIAQGALLGGMKEKNIFQFEEAQKAGKFVEKMIREGDIILIKGSQNMRMERAVEEMMEHPEKKEELLVRQTKEWLAM